MNFSVSSEMTRTVNLQIKIGIHFHVFTGWLCQVVSKGTLVFLLMIYVQCNQTYQSKFCLHKNFEISCLALIFNLSNQRMTILHENKWLQIARYNE